MDNFETLLGRQIIFLRKQRNLSLDELADKARISMPFLSNLERGVRVPSVETLKQIAAALGVTVGELFYFEHQTNSNTIDPITAPLIEYLRKKRLSREQINELVDVAKALFGE